MSNQLIHEHSPYLVAHSENPVNWRPWADSSLGEARLAKRPIFVSIGYSACHWCHVMAREAFSDLRVAEILNSRFVSIKVDREERPDIDQILQMAHQTLTGQAGGWPLNAFLEPESLMPFFSGTYYPLSPRYGLPGFSTVLEQIVNYFGSHYADIQEHGMHLSSLFLDPSHLGIHVAPQNRLAPTPIDLGCLMADYDPQYGGFGFGSKFPLGPRLTALLQNMPVTSDPEVRSRIRNTLDQLGKGGLQDHIGGGFFRYTIDRQWRFPHFEKMLFDNAQLLSAYAEAASQFKDSNYASIAHSIVDFLEEELSLPNGGYASSLSSEASGEEGRYYLWDHAELRNILTSAQLHHLRSAYALNELPAKGGLMHIALPPAMEELDPAIKKKLKTERGNRLKPDRDDKLITSWNALTITGLARAALFLGVPDYARMAERLFEQLLRHQWKADTLYSCALSDTVYQPAFLEDYAFLAQAALDLNPVATDSTKTILVAQLLVDTILKYFLTDAGQFPMTPAQLSTPYRPLRYNDDSLPSGAAVALRCLLTLGTLCGRRDYLETAHATLSSIERLSLQDPSAHPTMMTALWEAASPCTAIILRGDTDIDVWLSEAVTSFPGARILHLPPTPPRSLAQYGQGSMTRAYVCHGTTCSAPLKTPSALRGASVH